MNRTQILGIIRHVITFASGVAVAKGIVSESGAGEIGGGLLSLREG